MIGDLLVPDLAEPIVAFRCFKPFETFSVLGEPDNRRSYGYLHSMTVWDDDLWVPGQAKQAACHCNLLKRYMAAIGGYVPQGYFDYEPPVYDFDPCPYIPNPTGKCGLYGFKDFDRMLDQYKPVGGGVYGLVYLWGSVVEHEHGYRAEFGEPKALFEFPSTMAQWVPDEAFDTVVDRYNLEVLPWPR